MIISLSMNELMARQSAQLERYREEGIDWRDLAAHSLSASTRRGYRLAVDRFVSWSRARGLPIALPWSPETVAQHIGWMAGQGMAVGSIGIAVAAINWVHEQREMISPTHTPALKRTMAGLRRTSTREPRRVSPVTPEVMRSIIEQIDTSHALGIRDRAMILLGWACALRRSELCALGRADIERTSRGMKIRIRRSKTDQEGKGQTVVIPRETAFGVVEAIEAWLAVRDSAIVDSGPLFVAIHTGRRGTAGKTTLRNRPVTAGAWALRIKHYVSAAGLDASKFSGHSLRAGFATSAAEAGATVMKIAEVTRHAKLETVLTYVREVDRFRDHAGSGWL